MSESHEFDAGHAEISVAMERELVNLHPTEYIAACVMREQDGTLWVCPAEELPVAGVLGVHPDDLPLSYPRRVQDLLETNNRYLERARKAEARIRELEAEIAEYAGLSDKLRGMAERIAALSPPK
jgi:hypothetical protein